LPHAYNIGTQQIKSNQSSDYYAPDIGIA